MIRKLGTASITVTALAIFFAALPVRAQFTPDLQRRTTSAQEREGGTLVTLAGNVRPEANRENDRGPVAENFPMEHMLLQLRRPPEQERALQQFIDELHAKSSPNFHRWTNAQKFGENFGPSTRELDDITSWLESTASR